MGKATHSVSNSKRTGYAIVSFLPILCVLALSLVLTARLMTEGFERTRLGSGWISLPAFSSSEWLAYLGCVFGIAMLQMVAALLLILHMGTAEQLSAGKKVGWALALFFLGGPVAPIYWLLHIATARQQRR